MGRKNSLAKNSIQMLCVMQHLDEQNLYEPSLWQQLQVGLISTGYLHISNWEIM